MRLGRHSSVRTDFGTRENRARASFQTVRGQGVDWYNFTTDVARRNKGSSFNFNSNYFANRAEVGLSHFGTIVDAGNLPFTRASAVSADTVYRRGAASPLTQKRCLLYSA